MINSEADEKSAKKNTPNKIEAPSTHWYWLSENKLKNKVNMAAIIKTLSVESYSWSMKEPKKVTSLGWFLMFFPKLQ